MNQTEQRKNAKAFVERWSGKGDEKQDAQSFWRDLLVNVLGVPSVTLTSFISFERKVRGGYIDGFIEDTGVLIEQKSLGIDLLKAKPQSDGSVLTPFEQAARYAAKLPRSIRPRWIITCNFETFLIYDQEEDPAGERPSELRLSDFPKEAYRLSFIVDKSNSRIEREKELSVKAGEVVGKLYGLLSGQYKNIDTDKREQRSLNILIVRLVFLLYAEDAGLLQRRGALYEYLKPIPVPQMRQAVIDLFKVLDTPDGSAGTEDERDPYLPEELLAFPYINGGLFADESITIPQFTDEIKLALLLEASSGFDWHDVSPTIFGAVFESTLNPETRHEGGMHYTSVENIHKVIDPLFLDDLRSELERIEALKTERDRKVRLKAFQAKLASIRILDPACGSGNFLTESYLSLRKLENRVLENLQGDQMGMGFEGDSSVIKVSLSQFYGIEINDFAVSVAKTALWIAESQMMEATQEILMSVLDFLPLKSNSNIVEGNALRMDWKEIVPNDACTYIVGNPPFLGASNCSALQKSDVTDLFRGVKLANSLDYVSGWYYKVAEYIEGTGIRCALVSTNSITMGEMVAPLWKTLVDRFRIAIDFAWTTFVWSSEAADKAHVHVVVIGFSWDDGSSRVKYLFNEEGVREAKNISPYLIDAPTVFVESRSRPLSDVPRLTKGNQPSDGGNLIMTVEEADSLIREYPEAREFIRPYIGAKDFLHGGHRRCLWLRGADLEKAESIPPIKERLDAVARFRAASTAAPTRKKAAEPHLFFSMPQTDEPYLIIPRHSSERRRYIPIAFEDPFNIASDAVSIIPGASLFLFGVLHSNVHNAWMRTVAGRLKSDYRYSGGVVYNTFVFPSATECQRKAIEKEARRVLAVRESYPAKTLAELYDPDGMPEDLEEAHFRLDSVVEKAYGVDFGGDEEKIIAHLFELYAAAVRG